MGLSNLKLQGKEKSKTSTSNVLEKASRKLKSVGGSSESRQSRQTKYDKALLQRRKDLVQDEGFNVGKAVRFANPPPIPQTLVSPIMSDVSDQEDEYEKLSSVFDNILLTRIQVLLVITKL